MIQFKVSIHCGNTNAVHLMEGESAKEVYDEMQELIINAKSTGHLVVLPMALINPDRITFVTVEEYKAPEPVVADTIEV